MDRQVQGCGMASYKLDFEYPTNFRGNGTVEWIEANTIGNLEEWMNTVTMCRRWKFITRYLGCIDMVVMGYGSNGVFGREWRGS